ncbi:MAG: hypothetical protein ACKVP5_01210 [Aestuariivirga sp.]
MTPPIVLVPVSIISAFGTARLLGDRWAITCRPQENPWFLLELDSRHHVNHVEISYGARPGRPPAARIAFSSDGFTWSKGHLIDRGQQWQLVVDAPAQLLCISFEGFTDVHVPVKVWGRLGLQYVGYGFFDHLTKIYAVTKDAGFFSNMLTAIRDILYLIADGIDVENIETRRSYGYYREEPGQDVHALFHAKNLSLRLKSGSSGDDSNVLIPQTESWNRINFANLPFGIAGKVIEKFYQFNSETNARALDVLSNLGADLSRTICIYYRGTDKAKEYGLAPIEVYLEVCDRFLERHPDFRVLAQSDDGVARDIICQHYGPRAFVVPGVPVSMDGAPLHVRKSAGRIEGLGQFLVAFQIMLKCRYIVCTSSNVSVALALYRGSARNMVVIRESGEISDYSTDES